MSGATITVDRLWTGEPTDLLVSRARRVDRGIHGTEAVAVHFSGSTAVAFGHGWGSRRQQLEYTIREQRRMENRRDARTREAATRTLPAFHSSPAIDTETEDPMYGISTTPFAPNDPLQRALRELAYTRPVVSAPAFPATAKKGAKVRLSSKTRDHLKAEFVIGAVTLDARSGRVTHVAPEGHGAQTYSALDFAFTLITPAPVALPTEDGLYVAEHGADDLREGDAGVRVFALDDGEWTSHLATLNGDRSRRETEETVRRYSAGKGLVKLVPAP